MSRIVFRQFLVLMLSLLTLTLLTYSLTYFLPKDSTLTLNHLSSGPLDWLQSYFHYIINIFNGNWGLSAVSGQEVLTEFINHFPATIELSTFAMLLALSVGIPLGITAAKNKNCWQDKLVISTTLIGYSMPIFWWGMLLVLFFSLSLGITPVAGRLGYEYDINPITGFMLIDTLISEQPYAIEAFKNALKHLILPSIVLATIPIAIFARVTRSAMIDALSSDYIRTSKSKGMPNSRIIWLHALRNALIPVVTIFGLQISVLITGTLITETIFSWPGIGKWLLDAVYRRDLVTIHGGLLAISVIVILTNALVEIVTHLLDPKLRYR